MSTPPEFWMVFTLGLQAVGGIFVAGFTRGEVGAGERVDPERRRVLVRDNATNVAGNHPVIPKSHESLSVPFLDFLIKLLLEQHEGTAIGSAQSCVGILVDENFRP